MTRPLNCMVVDDEFLIAFGLSEQLKRLGHSDVATFQSSDDALTYLADHTPDMAFVDLNLGRGQSGLAVIDRLKELGVAFILISGIPPSDGTLETAAILLKPFSKADLIQKIASVLYAPD